VQEQDPNHPLNRLIRKEVLQKDTFNSLTEENRRISELQKTKEELDLLIKDIKQDIKDMHDKMDKVKINLDDNDKHEKDIEELQKTLDQLGTKKRDTMRDKEKEKAEEITSLRKKMTSKIEELKHNYIDSNNDRIQAITQLTMLQNSQLTNELDFQSGKADKSLSKNQNLQE